MMQLTWGWQPALYLFLGGMGAGAFVMAAILYLRFRTQARLAICVSMWAAFASLAVGLLLLLAELIKPLRGLLMWQSFSHFTSWMTYGAWGAFAAMAVFALSAFLATPAVGRFCLRKWKRYGKYGVQLRRALAVVGIALGCFVAVYTGMLLMTAESVPLWNTPLLPALFTVSAFDTGVALVEVVSLLLAKRSPLSPAANAFLKRVVVALVLLEVGVLACFAVSMLSGDEQNAVSQTGMYSMELLIFGEFAPYFWGMVVICGLAAPFVAAIVGLVLGHKNRRRSQERKCTKAVMLIGAAGALVGGCELRFLVLAAGVHADLITETVLTML